MLLRSLAIQLCLLHGALAWGWAGYEAPQIFGLSSYKSGRASATPAASGSSVSRRPIPTGKSRMRMSKTARRCASFAAVGNQCGDSMTNCCAPGSICSDMKCVRTCPSATMSKYCATQDDCPASFGYTCVDNQCQVPAGASLVPLGAACDQGTGNTRFCEMAVGVCAAGQCVACTLH